MPAESLKTGEVARRAGVHVETLRYYERRRLLPRPPRTPSGYRAYSPEAVRVVRFVKRAQDLGFTLKEVGEILALRGDSRSSRRDVRGAASRKLALIRAKIRALSAMESALARLVRDCSGRGPLRGCPILDVLQERGTR